MSRVFLAEETALHRKVVVKVLPPEMAGQVSIDRFQREIALAATLQHAHIVPLLTAGDAGGLPYFTMPYVRGESLRARIAKHGELPVSEAMRILREVASALAFAHDAGVVHRDIKPDNVLIAGGAAMVTDFGVAKALSASTTGGDAGGLTSLGVALGTPAYMAPEQATADPLTDHRADVYAWGILAYELLTGGTPFAGRPAAAMLAAQANETPEAITKRRGNLPPGLANLVMRCLEKRAADRPQHAAELVRALDEMVTPSGGLEPTSVHTATAARRKLAGRRSIAIAATAIVVLALAYMVWQRLASRTGAPRSIAVTPFVNKTGDTTYDYLAEGLSDEVRSQLAKVPGLTVMARSSSSSPKLLNLDPGEIGARLKVGSVLQGSMSGAGGRLRLTAELVNTADGSVIWGETYSRDVERVSAIRDSAARAIASALKLTPGGSSSARRVVNPEARDLYLRARHLSTKSTEAELRQALRYFERALEKDPGMAEAYAGIAWTWVYLADAYVSPAEAYPKTKAAALRAIALDSTLAEAHSALSAALGFHDWDFAAAERVVRRAISLQPQNAEARSTYGVFLGVMGRIDEAVAQTDSAIALDPLSSPAGWERQLVLYGTRRYRDLIVQRRRDFEIDPQFFYLDSFEGAAYRELGMLDSALAAFARVKALAGEQPLPELAITYARMGRKKEATEIARALEAWYQRHYYPPDQIAAVWASVGDMDRAFTWLARVFEVRSSFWLLLSGSPDYEAMRRDPRWGVMERRARGQ